MVYLFSKKLIIISLVNLFLSYKLYQYIKERTQEKRILIPIAMILENDSVYQGIMLITSILENSNKDTDYEFYILLPMKFYIDNRHKLLTLEVKYKNSKIHLIQPFEKYILPFKLNLFSLIPNNDKIIFLNNNTLVNKDLTDLYKTDIEDFYYAGVINNDKEKFSNKINLNRTIDTSVMLINLKKIRDNESMKNKLIQLYNKYQQDDLIINIICNSDNLKILDSKYAMQNFDNVDLANDFNKKITNEYRYDEKEFISSYYDPVISVLNCKPWENYKCEKSEIWWYYAKKSDFFDEIKNLYSNIDIKM